MTVEHWWLLDETPWPEQATLVYGEMVERHHTHRFRNGVRLGRRS